MTALLLMADPIEHLRLHTFLRVGIAGLRLDITQAVVFMWAGCVALVVTLVFAARGNGSTPRGLRTVVEAMLLFIREDIVKRNLGDHGTRYFPLIATLFFFILVCNWVGLVPLPLSYSATSNISVTAALALLVFVLVQVEGIRMRGFSAYLRGFIPAGVPHALLPLMVPIEIISVVARPFSLAIRLFANMLAGHILILVFLGMAATGFWFLKAMPLVGAVLMSLFEIFVGLVQAYIFSMLTAIYLSEVVGEA